MTPNTTRRQPVVRARTPSRTLIPISPPERVANKHRGAISSRLCHLLGPPPLSLAARKGRPEAATRETPARPPERSWGSSAAFISWFTSVRSAVMRQNRVAGRPRGALGCPLERSGAPTEAVLERVTTAQHPRLPYLSRADGFSVAASSISARHSSELAVVDASPESGRSSHPYREEAPRSRQPSATRVHLGSVLPGSYRGPVVQLAPRCARIGQMAAQWAPELARPSEPVEECERKSRK